MADEDIIQILINQLGQSQQARMPKELKSDFIKIDGYTTEDLLQFTQKFAEFVNYYRNDIATPVNNWTKFFSEDTIKRALEDLKKPEEEKKFDVPPHLALFLTFLELYKKPQAVMNRITQRHLDFYYQEVLRLKQRPAIPDKAHVLIELKKNTLPITISSKALFSAGKDSRGGELLYAPVNETTLINHSQVASLRSLFLHTDEKRYCTVRYAPIANSSDGVGGPIQEFAWHGFGHADLPAAEVGFAIASPVLYMEEGERVVQITLELEQKPDDAISLVENFADNFNAFITGEKGWLGHYILSANYNDANNSLQLVFTIPSDEGAVIGYDAKIHGYNYATQFPIVQVLLQSDHKVSYSYFKSINLRKASITVDVSGVTSLKLENDNGALDPKKAFLPFGPQPTAGSRFMVGCEEALAKKLSKLNLTVNWKGAPNNFSDHYSGYEESTNKESINNEYFTATVSFTDGSNQFNNINCIQQLFKSKDASLEHTFFLKDISRLSLPTITKKAIDISALNEINSVWTRKEINKLLLSKPVSIPYNILSSTLKPVAITPETRVNFITFSLEKDFLHSTYRKEYVENIMKYGKDEKDAAGNPLPLVILNEPYTPAIQNISLSYSASSNNVPISSNLSEDFTNPDIQFFHLTYFGQMREHGYQRNQFKFLINKKVSLLPQYDNEGELLIGLKNLKGGESVNVLFQVAEGSANPEVDRQPITWSVLCDNYWKPLNNQEVLLDTTNQLLTSGTIQFIIPTDATTTNTILPNEHIWIKAAIKQQVTAVCQLIEVVANAIEVRYQGDDANHLSTVLEKGKITKLKNGLPGVKSVKQPYASFGGKPVETKDAFYTRVSERLRHKNRCITAWDYERIVLAAFPKIHKVKCIPHAQKGNWFAPGHVLIIVVPDLRNQYAVNPLAPKADTDTLAHIKSYLTKRIGGHVKVAVENPDYQQQIQLDFKIKFHSGYEFNFYSQRLEQQLKQFLSPWAFDNQQDINFGGKIYKSVLLNFVEELEYVDYITYFKMYDMSNDRRDIDVAQAERPDAILVSNENHMIGEIT